MQRLYRVGHNGVIDNGFGIITNNTRFLQAIARSRLCQIYCSELRRVLNWEN
ncbi:MAG: hypothetical protein F6K21_22295 [Symploca sp. SIO2D2]|nr:hypothetical protein [Symploca sp. SIO2D2]